MNSLCKYVCVFHLIVLIRHFFYCMRLHILRVLHTFILTSKTAKFRIADIDADANHSNSKWWTATLIYTCVWCAHFLNSFEMRSKKRQRRNFTGVSVKFRKFLFLNVWYSMKFASNGLDCIQNQLIMAESIFTISMQKRQQQNWKHI